LDCKESASSGEDLDRNEKEYLTGWARVAIPGALLVLHNAQRLAPVPFFDELRQHLGADYVGVGNLFGAYLFAYALFNIPAGILADRFNTKHLMVTGITLSLLASAVFALAGSYPVAILSRFSLGVAGSFMYVPAVRYVVTSFPAEKRGTVMGVVEVGAGVGMIFALSLIPLLAKQFNLFTAFLALPVLAGAILGAVALKLSTQSPDRRDSTKSRFLTLRVNRSYWYLIVYIFLGMLAHYCVLGWFPTFLRKQFGYSAVEAGLMSTLMTLFFIGASPFTGILSDRLRGRTSVLLSGSILSVTSFALFVVGRDPRVVVGAALISGVSMAFTIPVSMILAGEMFGPTAAGLAVSVAAMTAQIASALSGMVFGYTLQTWNTFDAVWGLALVLAAGSIPFLLKARRLMRQA
jgi:predicted MFS family arabinose efflux permease